MTYLHLERPMRLKGAPLDSLSVYGNPQRVKSEGHCLLSTVR